MSNFKERLASHLDQEHTRRENFVGFVDMSVDEFTTWLSENGFEVCDYRFGDESVSLRKVDDEQVHIFLHNGHPHQSTLGQTKCYVFAHAEPSWDNFWSYSIAKANGPRAVNKVRTLLNKHGITYNDDNSIRD